MAEASISVDQDQFICPMCLDLLKDPVAFPCGHGFYKVCINGCWNQKGVYSCPQCRDTFTPLAEVVEKTEVQAASPAHCYAGPGDVECDFCTERKNKAVKSCLVCLASFCEIHLKPHLEIPGLKKHTLIEASAELQEKICSEHDEVLKIYCRTDQICICSLCMLDKHKGHDTVSVAAGRAEKVSKIKEEQMKSQQRIQEKQKKVQELKQAVNTLKLSAQIAVEDSEIIFTELISYMEKKRSEVTELIRAQEKAQLSRAERLLEQLEQEIADLQKRVTELEELSHTHDHIHFLQSFQSLCVSSERDDSSSITVHQHLSFNGVRNSLSGLKKKFEEFCEEEFSKIPPQVEDVQILPSEPKRREDYLKCEFNIWSITPEEREEHDKQFDLFTHTLGNVSGVQVRKFFLQSGLSASVLAKIWELADMGKDGKMDRLEFSIAMKLITLKLQGHPLPTSLPIIMKQTPFIDPNTAHHNLILSENNRAVRYSMSEEQYSDHPERFDSWPQVLCKESVCGRCYWEVERRGAGVSISVSYKGISRKGKGDECRFACNNQSWSLECSSSLIFWHNNINTKLRGPSSSRIGVYVDHSAGTLSFYSVSDTMKLLHRVHTTFTQPLYAGIEVGLFSKARLCDSE